MSYYVNQFQITWYQLSGDQAVDTPIHLGVKHPEGYLWSFDPIIRDQALTDGGLVGGLQYNWVDQIVPTNESAYWESPVIDIGYGWKPDSIEIQYDDRWDAPYASFYYYYRLSDTAPTLDDEGNPWQSGKFPGAPFNGLDWNVWTPKTVFDSTSQYVQIMIGIVTTDVELTYPVIKGIRLAKKWWEPSGLTLPNSNIKYRNGIEVGTKDTDFYGLTLDATSEGWYTSGVHDFGEMMHPRMASWYANTPEGTYLDTLLNGGGTIQVRGSNIAPIGGWSQDHLPDLGDPVWGIGGSLENSWFDIQEGQLIRMLIGIVRYAQFRVKIGVNS